MTNMTPQDYCDLRDHLFSQILELGKDHGFSDVSLTVKDSLENGETFEWDLKVSFRKEKK